ncbi:hypothetical protein BDB00DRAFT_818469, partial [Zychaea mexicana]|uniref:uncharacterized protein n=1 Tax=Zychaea mexicana TaxID=64656 RepID=UPI0022FDE361
MDKKTKGPSPGTIKNDINYCGEIKDTPSSNSESSSGDGFSGSAENRIPKDTRPRIHFSFCEKLSLIIVLCFALYNCIPKSFPDYYPDICGKWPSHLTYPRGFPEVESLNQLDYSIRLLATNYGEELLGPCYAPVSFTDNCGNSIPDHDVFFGMSSVTATQTAAATTTTTPSGNKLQPRITYDTTADFLTASASFSAHYFRRLSITADDDIDLTVDFLDHKQNADQKEPVTAPQQSGAVGLYLREQQQEIKYNNGDDDYPVDIFQMNCLHGRLNVHIKHGPVWLDVEKNYYNVNSASKAYHLQVLLPEDSHLILEHISIFLKEGRVHANSLGFNKLFALIGRGSVKLSGIKVNELNAAVLDGQIYMPGVKFTKNLAAGVLRGSSTVVGDIDRNNSQQPYNLINIVVDGDAQTQVMTPVSKYEGLAANFYLNKGPGCERTINVPGYVYVRHENDHLITHVDRGSRNYLTKGYFISKNSGSHVLAYSGRDLRWKCQTRLQYRFYDNTT